MYIPLILRETKLICSDKFPFLSRTKQKISQRFGRFFFIFYLFFCLFVAFHLYAFLLPRTKIYTNKHKPRTAPKFTQTFASLAPHQNLRKHLSANTLPRTKFVQGNFRSNFKNFMGATSKFLSNAKGSRLPQSLMFS